MRKIRIGARRDHAERYLLLMIAAFAITVAVTRWYLDLTGYPKVGGGGLHIAHMLWGGLLLIVAAIVPLVLVGRRMLLLTSVAAGIGVGLFIDEVGKFITESNDYFFAPAAPLIYGALLLLVALWLAVRRGPTDAALDAMQAAVDATRDGLDGRLNALDRDRVVAGLAAARASADPALTALADQQAALLLSPAMDARLGEPGWVARGDAQVLLERVMPLRLERVLIALGLLWTVIVAAFAALLLLALAWARDPLEITLPDGPVEFPADPVWAIALLVVAVVVGVAGGIALVAILRHHEQAGLRLAIAATLLNLVAGGLLNFFVSQFGAMTTTVLYLVLLGLLLDYQRRLADPG
jgi:hypothetical protein